MIALRMMILAVVGALLMTQAHALRRSFVLKPLSERHDILDERDVYPAECQGSFSVPALQAVNDLCLQCENVTRQPDTLANCKANCFSNSIFVGCLDVLELPESEKATYRDHVQLLGK
ncbi:crustacean hyperglycemic hormone 6-like [Penaeus chinensis]|uniref:Hyperglycemic hormone 1-like protein n=1 Tax=Penaeus chinensis TaxID=139456 RepID=H9BFB2_PENCE|nr:crustacean hyperglycemic hormone 6-like [Penaeus chinensis]AFD32402.1 hyperglycemic hormone 1-like protein [Penaeus chinensis]